MRQAIVTKYLGPTNFRGSRVKASADAGSVTVPWDHALNVEDNHMAAAMTLASRKGWAGDWHGGALPRSASHAYAFVKRDDGAGFVLNPSGSTLAFPKLIEPSED